MVQYLIEEAVFERLEIEDARRRASEITTAEADPMAVARAFAEGRI